MDQCYDYNADETMNWCVVYHYDDEGKYMGRDEYDGAGNLLRSIINEG